MNAKLSFADRQRRISELAHRIWESEGRPAGQSLRHWLMAEKLVIAHEQRETPAKEISPLSESSDN